ncbi:glutamate--tRNA ligase [Candidatus Babeliales bacterium]|nr:glutamate--tRNA ligase [Candidatus Babeliales bacterium]
MSKEVRVRFAPSPTGFLHLGNIRAALINYLFAHQKNGKFILRIEDTDKSRNLDEAAFEILQDLKWLGLKYDEGPILGGKYGPYYQSQRTEIYQKHLNDLILNQKIYRCFCSMERLDQMRQEQMAQGKPPRYDRKCLNLSNDNIKQKLVDKEPFIWRFKLDPEQFYEIEDMARGKIKFEMRNFSDFALTRQDGSFTFLFTNFVDDWLMNITHVIRGEDHLSNTALQAAMFDDLAVTLPKFWHLPMICNKEGKKLSKRDFGFSLKDLKKEGFLPESICNYLGIIGVSFEQEIASLEDLSKKFDFENISSTGPIRFDIEKLTWINHKWIQKGSLEKLANEVKPFLYEKISQSKNLDDEKLKFFLSKLRSDMKTLKDVSSVLNFYFEDPKVEKNKIENQIGKQNSEIILDLIYKHLNYADKTELFLNTIKFEGKEKGLKIKEIFGTIRYLLTGKFEGPSIHDIFQILEDEKIKKRLARVF